MAPDVKGADEGLEAVENIKRVGNVEVILGDGGVVEGIRLAGRILHLVDDAENLRLQLSGGSAMETSAQLINGVSTDALIAARPDCYRFDSSLGGVLLRTLEVGGQFPFAEEGAIKDGGFGAIVAGADWGCGSSREHAALSLLYAGIGVVSAPSIAPIHKANLVNSGMFPIDDDGVYGCLEDGDTISFEDLSKGLGHFQQRIMRRGGLFPFMKALQNGEETLPEIETPRRPMTMGEQIIAKHMRTKNGAVKPGDSGLLDVDVTLCHDYTTAQVDDMIQAGLGRPPVVKSPDRHHSFPDHLTLMAQGQAGATREEVGMVVQLRDGQDKAARRAGIVYHSVRPGDATAGSDGICHQIFKEEIAKPGQVIVGTDSHTCSSGALNNYAFGVGSSQIATAWEGDVIQATVPRSVRFNFTGSLPVGCAGKDVMLYLAGEARKFGQTKGAEGVDMNGKVLEFCGEGLSSLNMDDQFVLANMATECSAQTGIVSPNEVMLDYLVNKRGLDENEVLAAMVEPDEGAEYDSVVEIDLSKIVPAVAKPGHTGNFSNLVELGGTKIDKAYSGSCTAGSLETLETIAKIVRGRTVKVETHVQAGSVAVLREATARGIIAVLEEAGITVIKEPGCGACLAAGPGGPAEGEVVISSTNRNFPKRMGDGLAYLANPAVVASAALRGRIPTMEEYMEDITIAA